MLMQLVILFELQLQLMLLLEMVLQPGVGSAVATVAVTGSEVAVGVYAVDGVEAGTEGTKS